METSFTNQQVTSTADPSDAAGRDDVATEKLQDPGTVSNNPEKDSFELIMEYKRSVVRICVFLGIPLVFTMGINNFAKGAHLIALLNWVMLLILGLLGFGMMRRIKEKFNYALILIRLFIAVAGMTLLYEIGFQSKFSRIEWCYIYSILVFFAVGAREGMIWISIFYAILAYLILNFDLQGITPFEIHGLKTRFLVSFFAVCILSFLLENGYRRIQKRLLHHHGILKESENRYRQAYEQLNVEMQERKRAEESLLHAAEEWRTTFDSINDFVCLLDLEGKILRCNRAMKNFLGKPFNEIINHSCWEMVLGTKDPIENCPFSRMKETLHRETASISVNDRWYDITIDPILDQSRHLIGAINIISDITELKQGEKNLERLAQENAIMAEIGRIISSTLNIEDVFERFAEEVRKLIPFDRININIINPEEKTLNFLYVAGQNVAGRETGNVIPLAGTAAEWIRQNRTSLLIREENREEIVGRLPGLSTIFQTGLRSMMLTPLISKDEVIGVLDLATFKQDAYTEADLRLLERVSNQIAGAIANAQLFAEHKRAEEALKESEDRYRDLVECSQYLISTHDLQGRLLSVNQEGARQLGYEQRDLLGKSIRDFLAPEVRDEFDTYLETLQKQGAAKGLVLFQTAAGEKRIWEYSTTLRTEGVASPIVRSIAHDVTESIRAQKAMAKLSQENAIMARIGRIVSSTLNIEEVYSQFGEEVRKVIPFDWIGITLFDHERGVFHNEYVLGNDVPGREFRAKIHPAGTLTEKVMHTRSAHVLHIEDRDELVCWLPGLLPHYDSGFRSFLSVPLISKDQVIGVLHIFSLKSRAYTEADKNLAESIGNQIAGAIANAQLFAERKRAEEAEKELAHENAIMAEIGRIISSSLDVDEVYERFTEEVRKLIPFDRIVINTIDAEKKTVINVYMAGRGLSDRKVGQVYPLDGSGNAEMVRTRSTLLIQTEDFSEYKDRFPMLVSTFEAGFRSIMNVPLFSKGEVIGGLLLRSMKPYAYTEKHVKLAEKVADQIAGAIANAQLFAEQKRAEEAAKNLAQENAVVAEIGRIISSTLNIDEVYERFAEEVRKVISFDRVSVSIINPDPTSVTITYASGIKVGNLKEGVVLPLDEPYQENVVRRRQGLLIRLEDENQLAKDYPHLVPHFRTGIRSVMTAPLISKDQVIGLLHFQSLKPNVYTALHLNLAERVSNQIAGAIANAQLFAERERAEESLRQSEEKYRTILENIEDGYFEVDLQGNLTFFNEALCEKHGYSKEEMLGMNNRDFMDEESAKKVYNAFNEVFLTGKPIKAVDYEITRRDGTRKFFEASAGLIRDSNGEPVGFRGIVRDITERKLAEEEKMALQEQLRQSQKMEAIGRLAGGVAHDFNNLLTVIHGYCDLMLRDMDENNRFFQDLTEIRKASEQAASLTRQLLAFSRKQVLQPKILDINFLILNMEKMLRRMIGEDIQLVSLLSEDLGRVKVDVGQIEQVIFNLAVNARDAMPNGGKLTIETGNVVLGEEYARLHVGVKPGHYVMLSVSDTGIGMTPEIKERIFDPFFTTKEKGKGTGLGLSTVYGIVQQSGGTIWVYSEPGRGATFKIYLPRIDEVPDAIEPKLASIKSLRGSETILLVEDEEAVKKFASTTLQSYGYKVLEAGSGEEALQIIHEQPPGPIHLMLTDVVMPGMSGRELASSLQPLQPEMKVLYMSGYTDNAIVHHGVLDPGVAYIQKPFTAEALVTKVREILDTPQPKKRALSGELAMSP